MKHSGDLRRHRSVGEIARRSGVLAIGLACVAVLVGACAGPTPSGRPSPGPSGGTGSPSAAPSPCEIHPAEGKLVSDRLVDLDVSNGSSVDLVVFRFGPPTSLGLEPQGRLREVHPPFVEGASGLPLEVPGERFVEILFEGMYLYDETGTPTFTGDHRHEPVFPALAAVVNAEEFEGYSTWIVGFRGPGCVELDLTGGNLTVAISH